MFSQPVNLNETKVLAYENGVKLSQSGKWIYTDVHMEVDSSYISQTTSENPVTLMLWKMSIYLETYIFQRSLGLIQIQICFACSCQHQMLQYCIIHTSCIVGKKKHIYLVHTLNYS